MTVQKLISTLLKSISLILSLFGTIFKYKIIITFLFLMFENEILFIRKLSVNRFFLKLSYQNNIFKSDFNNFNTF